MTVHLVFFRSHLQSFLEDILKRLHDLLILNTPDNGTRLVQLSNEDQLFVYETAGILVVQSQFEPEVSTCSHILLFKTVIDYQISTIEIKDFRSINLSFYVKYFVV